MTSPNTETRSHVREWAELVGDDVSEQELRERTRGPSTAGW